MRDTLVYFSMNTQRKRCFIEFVKKKGVCYYPKQSFVMAGDRTRFKDPRDLIDLIEQFEDKSSLHVIVDYISWSQVDKFDNYTTVFRDLIMCYPEVQFLFDETYVNHWNQIEGKHYNFLNFLFRDAFVENNTVSGVSVMADFHTFIFEKDENSLKKQFKLLLRGRNNTFDASNLRCAIKTYKFGELSVNDNFSNITNSRRDHSAVVVEEERHQNYYNSYCLYASGYRVFPITTATELIWINKKTSESEEQPLLLRDYDLQFVDEKEAPHSKSQIGWNEIDHIRGAKYTKNGTFQLSDKKSSQYWSSFSDEHSYFLSKGGAHMEVRLKNKNNRQAMTLIKRGKKLLLNGIKKPLEGVYVSTRNIKEIKERYKSTRYSIANPNYIIDIKRKGNLGHSCPLDIYGIVRSMVHRAENYYQKGRYRMAALVSGEALLLLNGFHVSLMKTAYFVQAVSENAMSMSLLGGDELVLSKDVAFRMQKVKEDVARMISEKKDQDNVLYNIFNDCRLFCREKEYFDAADYALSAMMHKKEGCNIINALDSIVCKGLRNVRIAINKHRNNNEG